MLSESIDNNIRFVSFPEDSACWYETEFLEKLRDRIKDYLEDKVLLNVFVIPDDTSGGKIDTERDKLLKIGIETVRRIMVSRKIFLSYASGDVKDGQAGFFLASDLRVCSDSTALSYSTAPYMGEITSLRRFPAINPYLLLTGEKILSVEEMVPAGLIEKICESEEELEKYLNELEEKSFSSVQDIKELNQREPALTFRQGNMLEKAVFSLRFAGNEFRDRLTET